MSRASCSVGGLRSCGGVLDRKKKETSWPSATSDLTRLSRRWSEPMSRRCCSCAMRMRRRSGAHASGVLDGDGCDDAEGAAESDRVNRSDMMRESARLCCELAAAIASAVAEEKARWRVKLDPWTVAFEEP
eukprot:6180642-Pleurochrysis_carterae.AAC.1